MDTKKASDLWDKGRLALFDFAAEIADGQNVQIARLAAEKDRTPSLFYGYQIGGLLWNDMLAEYPSEAEIWRDHLEIGFWVALGRYYKNKIVDIEKAKTSLIWLMDNRKEKRVTVDKYRELLAKELGDAPDVEPTWTKKCDWIEKNCVYFPAFGIDDANVRKIQRAARLLQGRILAASGGSSDSTSGVGNG